MNRLHKNKKGRRKLAAVDTALKVGKFGVHGIGAVISSVLKIFGTVLLIAVTAGLLFCCIFVVYIKTNLTGDLDLSLEEMSLNVSSVVFAKDGDTGDWTELAVLQGEQTRFWVDYEDIPLDLEHAVVAIEDMRFYTHHGVDWYRTGGAFFNMFLGMRDTFGGSTLTQQLIKNITENDDVTVQRKLREILQALELEKDYEKKDIVEWYLNVVYFGHGRYGIGAAAKYYFDKELSELSLAEMAAIVGITNNPSIYSPFVSTKANKDRQEDILYVMKKQRYIDNDTYLKASNEKLVFTRTEDEEAEKVVYSYFIDALIEDVIDAIIEVRGCTYKIAQQILFNSGYQIYATIDPEIQKKVDSVYTDLEQIPKPKDNSGKQLQSAIVITDPYTGNIVALSGGVGEKTISRGLNRATGTKRPPGSSLKPISVYAPAIELGLITPSTKFEDSEDVALKGTTWMPMNDDRKFNVIVDVRTAVRRSINTVSAQVLDMLTPSVSFNFLKKTLHVESLVEARDGKSDMDYAPLALGQLTDGIKVREMAAAFNIFPNSGVYTDTRTFTKICDSDGNLLYENVPRAEAAVSETTAYWMTVMLNDAATNGTGSSANLGKMPTAGKTGTSTNNADRWFVGFTPYYTAAVWTGYDTPARISISGNPAAQLWKKVMSLVHENLEYRDFTKPANTHLAPVPGVEGADCTVRGIGLDGALLYEETEEKVVGKVVTVSAKEVEGYTLTDNRDKTFVVSSNTNSNLVTFLYVSNTPVEIEPEPEPEPEPEVPGEPENPEPSPEPEDPIPSPTVSENP